MLEFIAPQLATLVETPPQSPNWIFEIKYDGYRLEALFEHRRTHLFTRRGHDWTARFPLIAGQLNRLDARSAVIDGEVVVLDASGRSRFTLLQQSLDASRPQDHTFFAFDLLMLDGKDLRSAPLTERRKQLEALLRKSRMTTRGAIRIGQRLDGDGAALLRAACEHGLEGIMAKRSDAAYSSGRGGSWVKIKCGLRQEFVVIGFTLPKGSRVGVGSLLLAVNDQGRLRYAGRVGSGIPHDMLRGLLAKLEPIERSQPVLAHRPAGIPGAVRWVEPILVVEVSFTEWTADGLLRHPVFQGLREDKPARSVHREEPKMSPADAVVAGITITHPDRVVFPEAGVTKVELARHFERVAQVMLPHTAGRPLALVRCPEGAGGECFFQKHWPGTKPPAIDTVPIRQSDGKTKPHVVIHDVKGLVTLVQWGVIEIHPWGSRADDPDRPDRIIFDLDPGPGVEWSETREAARGLSGLLDVLGLESEVKTSGGKGLHVVVPIARRSSWDDASGFARGVAEHMQAAFPDRFISKASKAARRGVIFVDWMRNTRGATAVAPWCTRARPNAAVSVPIAWSQLGKITAGDQFTVASVQSKPPRTDPWSDLLSSRQTLSGALKKLRGVSASPAR